MKRVAVFCSGGGTDFQSIIDANEKEPFCTLALLVASKDGIGAMDRAKRHGIKSVVFAKKENVTYEETFAKINDFLTAEKIDFIVLAGYLSILDEKFVAKWKGRIINIHPSLIPSFCGKGYYGLKVHEAAIKRGVKISGATVHFVDEGADTGKIIMQRAVEVLDGDTAESLQKRILEIEHQMLPEAVKGLVEGKYKL
ncbi:MAG: phosphoribosylglycinamide formyltransferase [Christensenellales bacterium]